MTHISTRKPGTLCYVCDDNHVHYARVQAIVISSGVFIAQVFAESDDGLVFTDLEEEHDILRPVSDLRWYQSELVGESMVDQEQGESE